MKIMRLKAVVAETGYKTHTSIYALIKEGLFPTPISLGIRSRGWPDYEVQAINAARIAGKTNDEIRALVTRLHEKRQEMAALLEAA